MSLVKAAKNPQNYHGRQMRCSVCKLTVSLPEEESRALVSMLNDPEWEHAAISRALKEEGVTIDGVTIARHRRADCAYGRELMEAK